MVALTVAVTWLAAVPVDLVTCEGKLDAPAFNRLIQLEWADAPAGSHARVTCSLGIWLLHLELPGHAPYDETLQVPELSLEGRTRVLALVVGERARNPPSAPPIVALPPVASPSPAPVPGAPPPGDEERRAGAAAEPPRTVAVPSSRDVAPAPESNVTPLRASLFTLEPSGAQSHAPWRVSADAVTATPWATGPWRFGGRIALQWSWLTLGFCGTSGAATVSTGTIIATSLTVEPELTLVALSGQRWQLYLNARGIAGYGGITANTKDTTVVATRLDRPAFGGGGVLGFSVALSRRFTLDAEAALGGLWAAVATADGATAAALGGGFFGATLGLSTAWGEP